MQIRRKDKASPSCHLDRKDDARYTAPYHAGHAANPTLAHMCETARLQLWKTAGTEGDNEAV